MPTRERPTDECLDAIEASVPLLDEAGIDHAKVDRTGDSYISHARAFMLKQALEADADAVVFIDDDLSWEPSALLKIIQHPGDVVAGDYRFKDEKEEYMGKVLADRDGRPVIRDDGTLRAHAVPAGFLKVSRSAVERFRAAYPELVFGPDKEFVDLFNHGAHEGLWWGEDYAFSRRWIDLGGEIYLIPDLDITHHLRDGRSFPGNLHRFLMRQPGGAQAVAA